MFNCSTYSCSIERFHLSCAIDLCGSSRLTMGLWAALCIPFLALVITLSRWSYIFYFKIKDQLLLYKICEAFDIVFWLNLVLKLDYNIKNC